MFYFLLGRYLGVETIFQMVVLLHTPTSSVCLQFPHPCQHFFQPPCSQPICLIITILGALECFLILVLICISLMLNFFSSFYWPFCIFSLVNVYLNHLPDFRNCFVLLSCISSLYILDANFVRSRIW